MVTKKIFYIADFSIPNKSAYTVHVLKICDNFVKNGYNLTLLLYSNEKNISFKTIKKKYKLKKNFKIKYCFQKKRKRNFLLNLLFAFWCKKQLKKNQIVLSRSVIPGIFLSLLRFKLILEIHHELSGLTKIVYNFFKKLKLLNNLRYIFIHKNLKKRYNISYNKCIVLDDAVELEDFKSKPDPLKSCVYTGSFVKGKGIELIVKIAKLCPKIKFFAYGNINTLDQTNNFKEIKNLIFMNYIDYSKVPKVLKKNLILLMPYQKKISILAKDIYVQNYFSPLKLFEYLASGNIIIASKLPVYSHILKNNYNSLLCNPNNPKEWGVKINKVLSDPHRYRYLAKNSLLTVKKYTWFNRAKEILNFAKKTN